jgi:hypothetical protein
MARRSGNGEVGLPPERRNLRIYVSDPMTGRRASQRITIDIDNEPDLRPGPTGEIVQVVDYDGKYLCYYEPVDLNEPSLLMQNGLEPNESNPQFHQQMVYAVSMKVIETARRALGRPITFDHEKSTRLRLLPHGFVGANAFFDHKLNAILFGYFCASKTNPGPNLPGQRVFTCLSHDIIAHEVTHAIVHRLRRHFLEPTNVDVLAFHEAFSDIVALFQRFTYRDVLISQLQEAGGRLELARSLVELAQQFGQATGSGVALRSALGQTDVGNLTEVVEPHDRGAILVSAVFGGFLRVGGQRARNLFRIASNSGAKPPEDRLPPDLIERIAFETAQVADRVLRMCFRAFDYLPPVDVTFGDFLRALVTADSELNPTDPDELRYTMIEEFRVRGIYADGVDSLAEESLLLPPPPESLPPLPDIMRSMMLRLVAQAAGALDWSLSVRRARKQRGRRRTVGVLQAYRGTVLEADNAEVTTDQRTVARALHAYATEHARKLGLREDITLAVTGFHPVVRVGADQRLVVELVAQFVQIIPVDGLDGGSPPLRGGATLIFGGEGEPRYLIAKPTLRASQRVRAFKNWMANLSLGDPRMPWSDAAYRAGRFGSLSSLRRLHGG